MMLISLPLFLVAIIIHEYAHGWVADKLGDPTAKYAGRLTFNPLAHLDPLGTFFLPLLLMFIGSPFIFGWAKPVPINFSLLRHPKRDIFWVSIAGILANFLLAMVFSFFLKMNFFPVNSYGRLFLNYGILINLVLAVFNAVPCPPLDGSKILFGLLPQNLAYTYMALERFGFFILLALIWLGVFERVVLPAVAFLARILGASI